MKNKLALSFVLIGSVLSAQQLMAEGFGKGSLITRAGIAKVQPNDSSGEVTGIADSSVGVASDTQLGLTFSYMLSDNVAIGLLASTPFSHDIKASGSLAALGNIAEATHLPPTFTLQYHFKNLNNVKPYIGLGLNYTIFFDENTTDSLDSALGGDTDISLDDSLGLALEAGVDIQLSEDWYLNVAAWYIDIDTTAELKTDDIVRTVNVDIDPWVGMVGVGYRF